MSNEELNTGMEGESLDISEQKKRELAQMFPAAISYPHGSRFQHPWATTTLTGQ